MIYCRTGNDLFKDERISALLDSNNELSLELTQKNQTIQKNVAATAKKFQSELAKLKNEKSEEKKTNASAMKKLESELQKYRSYAGTIPHLQKQLETISQEKKKSKAIPKDSGSGDKL